MLWIPARSGNEDPTHSDPHFERLFRLADTNSLCTKRHRPANLPSTWASPKRWRRRQYRTRTAAWGTAPCPGHRRRPGRGTARCCRWPARWSWERWPRTPIRVFATLWARRRSSDRPGRTVWSPRSRLCVKKKWINIYLSDCICTNIIVSTSAAHCCLKKTRGTSLDKPTISKEIEKRDFYT